MIHVYRIYRTEELTHPDGRQLAVTEAPFVAAAMTDKRLRVIGTGDSPEAIAAAEDGFTGFELADEWGRVFTELVTERAYIFGYAS